MSTVTRTRTQTPQMARFQNYERYEVTLHELIDIMFEIAWSNELSWTDIANKSGCCYTTIHNLGTKRTRFPQLATIYRICAALRIDFKFQRGRFRLL